MFKDKIKTQTVGGIKIPELEGKVKIELFNAKTGEKEQEVEGKNIVTNAIRDIFASNYMGTNNYVELMPIYQKLFGGILCFQNALTENADNYYPPTTPVNPVIAHAGQTTYSSAEADTTRGLPNDIESGVVSNGYKWVWDFASTQGNGTISSLAMTHKDTGDFWLNAGSSYLPYTLLRHNGGYGTGWAGITNVDYNPVMRNTSSGRLYRLIRNSDATKLTIMAVNGGLLDGVGFLQRQNYSLFSDSVNALSKDFTLPYSFDNFTFMYFDSDDEIHAIYVSGSTLTKIVFALDDSVSNWTMTTTTHTISGASMTSFSNTNNHEALVTTLDKNGYFYAVGTNKVYKINYSNFADVTEIEGTIESGGRLFGYGNYAISPFGLYIVEGNRIVNVLGTGVTRYGVNNSTDGLIGIAKQDSPVLFTESGGYNITTGEAGYSAWLCKLYLATIKNLDSAVVKTSTQTMKITYTITEVQENS